MVLRGRRRVRRTALAASVNEAPLAVLVAHLHISGLKRSGIWVNCIYAYCASVSRRGHGCWHWGRCM